MKLHQVFRIFFVLLLFVYGITHPHEKSPLGAFGWLGIIGLASFLLAAVIEIPIRYYKAKKLLTKFPSLWEQVGRKKKK